MARKHPEPNWPPPSAQPERCALCERETPTLTEHHLVPRSQGRRRGLKVAALPTVMLCPACHKFLHKTFTNAELERDFNSIDALLEHADVQRFLKWARRQPASKYLRVR